MELRDFEDTSFFQGCLPVEQIAAGGALSLAYGPMKPVGLVDPSTGRRPFAVLQLRLENREATMYNLVGFQTRLRQADQRRIFGMIPALGGAEFLRYGSVHRNTYLNRNDSRWCTVLVGKRGSEVSFSGHLHLATQEYQIGRTTAVPRRLSRRPFRTGGPSRLPIAMALDKEGLPFESPAGRASC